MEVVLEHDEIKTLILEALASRHVIFPADGFTMTLRVNNKKGTIRAILKTEVVDGCDNWWQQPPGEESQDG